MAKGSGPGAAGADEGPRLVVQVRVLLDGRVISETTSTIPSLAVPGIAAGGTSADVRSFARNFAGGGATFGATSESAETAASEDAGGAAEAETDAGDGGGIAAPAAPAAQPVVSETACRNVVYSALRVHNRLPVPRPPKSEWPDLKMKNLRWSDAVGNPDFNKTRLADYLVFTFDQREPSVELESPLPVLQKSNSTVKDLWVFCHQNHRLAGGE